MKFIKPIVVISKCLGFEPCRYNGVMETNEFIKKLSNYVEFKTICPEMSIGLGVPRNPIRLVKDKEYIKLLEPKTGKDYSKDMMIFTQGFLKNIGEIDGFILKSRSPSCGIKDVKVYSNINKGGNSVKGKGMFANCIIDTYTNLPIEDEGRLRDFKIREHFLTKLYVLSNFRQIKKKKDLTLLKEFHNVNRLLFKAYNNKQFKEANNIVKKNNKDIFEKYEEKLNLIFARTCRFTSKINVLLGVLEKFKDKLTEKEKNFMLDSIEKYRNGNMPFSVPLNLMKSYIIRFEDELLNQSFFMPYPEELFEIRDSGKMIN